MLKLNYHLMIYQKAELCGDYDMKIKVVSDLHLEVSPYIVKNDQNYDLLILSGDILIIDQVESPLTMNGLQFQGFLSQVNREFPSVIYVIGNHELYHGHFHKSIADLRTVLENYTNIFLLEKDYTVIDNIAFIGGTLWTDCNNADPLTILDLPRLMNDYRTIRNDRNNYLTVKPLDTMQRHHETLQVFEKYLDEITAAGIEKVVVVTHHSPSYQGVTDEYKNDTIMNGGYHSNLDSFILAHPEIVLWTHGHTHSYLDYFIGNTRILCNPRGYHSSRGIEQTNWNENIVVEI
jgi:hypothetical protein